MAEKVEPTCWNCQDVRLCYLKRNFDRLLELGMSMLTIDGHAAFGRCYQDLHVTLGRSCKFYLENPDAT